ncbi:MAG: hypothetical protein JWP94_1060 [Mucilaginibacter sp.]|nr:hypothetical protein [Mucilaginibacter sp.]
MKFLIVFITSFIFIQTCYSQDDIQPDSLYKYSYFIYGNASITSIEKGTCYFIKIKRKIYLVTALHVLTGWNCFKHYKAPVYPDTMSLDYITKKI